MFMRGQTSRMRGKADVDVLTRLRNDGAETRRLELVATVRDADGRRSPDPRGRSIWQPGAAEVRQTLAVASPRLWDGRRDPYLYSITVEARDGGRAIDAVTQPLGSAVSASTPNDGFFLNGARLKLHGASRHQDRLGKGWALSPRTMPRTWRSSSRSGPTRSARRTTSTPTNGRTRRTGAA